MCHQKFLTLEPLLCRPAHMHTRWTCPVEKKKKSIKICRKPPVRRTRTTEPVRQAVTLISISRRMSTFGWWALPPQRTWLIVIKEGDQRLLASQILPFKRRMNRQQRLMMSSGDHPALNKQNKQLWQKKMDSYVRNHIRPIQSPISKECVVIRFQSCHPPEIPVISLQCLMLGILTDTNTPTGILCLTSFSSVNTKGILSRWFL